MELQKQLQIAEHLLSSPKELHYSFWILTVTLWQQIHTVLANTTYLYRLTNQASECGGLAYSFPPLQLNLISHTHCYTLIGGWGFEGNKSKRGMCVRVSACMYTYTCPHIGVQCLATCSPYHAVPMLGHKTT